MYTKMAYDSINIDIRGDSNSYITNLTSCMSPGSAPVLDSPNVERRELSHVTTTKRGLKRKRERTTFTKFQLRILADSFGSTTYPDVHRRREIARQIQLPESKVQVWFKNQRQKSRRAKQVDQSSAVDRSPKEAEGKAEVSAAGETPTTGYDESITSRSSTGHYNRPGEYRDDDVTMTTPVFAYPQVNDGFVSHVYPANTDYGTTGYTSYNDVNNYSYNDVNQYYPDGFHGNNCNSQPWYHKQELTPSMMSPFTVNTDYDDVKHFLSDYLNNQAHDMYY